MAVLAFDIYGTLIDPISMQVHLAALFGDAAREASELWRQKQLEYSFRRAIMQRYVSFPVCTEQALEYVCGRFGVELTDSNKRELLDHYLKLPAYADVARGLELVEQDGHTLIAFSNGTEDPVRGLLDNAGVLHRFRTIVSVDDVRTFKPSPLVYEYLVDRCGVPKSTLWMISSNPFDVIGAKACGLKAVWLQRDPRSPFDAWEFSPDATVHSMEQLAGVAALKSDG